MNDLEQLTIFFAPALAGDKDAQAALVNSQAVRRLAEQWLKRSGAIGMEGATEVVNLAWGNLATHIDKRLLDPARKNKLPVWNGRGDFLAYMARVIGRVVQNLYREQQNRWKHVIPESSLQPDSQGRLPSEMAADCKGGDRQLPGSLTHHTFLTLAEALDRVDTLLASAWPSSANAASATPGDSVANECSIASGSRDATCPPSDPHLLIKARRSLPVQIFEMQFFLGYSFNEIGEAFGKDDTWAFRRCRIAICDLRPLMKGILPDS